MTIYMKYGDIEGDATLSGYQNWINLLHFNWQVDWTIASRATIKSGTRDNKHPKMGDITIKKETDAATKDLLEAICRPKNPHGEKCVIRFQTTGQDPLPDDSYYLEYIFHESLITSISYASEGDRPTEVIVINFTGVEMNVWALNTSNEWAGPYRFQRYNKVQDK